jgi:hypothetical protein
MYPAPGSVVIKEEKRESAAYRSNAKREVIKPKSGPGVGDYNIIDHFSVS